LANATGHLGFHLLEALGHQVPLFIQFELKLLNLSLEFVADQLFARRQFRLLTTFSAPSGLDLQPRDFVAAAYAFRGKFGIGFGATQIELVIFLKNFDKAALEVLFLFKCTLEVLGDFKQRSTRLPPIEVS
jgi:hypothetical protein